MIPPGAGHSRALVGVQVLAYGHQAGLADEPSLLGPAAGETPAPRCGRVRVKVCKGTCVRPPRGRQWRWNMVIAHRWETRRNSCKPHAAAGSAAGHNRRPLVGQSTGWRTATGRASIEAHAEEKTGKL